MYCTLSPCIECAKLMIQSGITRFVFKELYKNDAGIRMLLEFSGIKVDKI